MCAFQNMVAHHEGLPIVLQYPWQSDSYLPWISSTLTLMTVQVVSKYYQMVTGVGGGDSQMGASGLARASLNTLRLIS